MAVTIAAIVRPGPDKVFRFAGRRERSGGRAVQSRREHEPPATLLMDVQPDSEIDNVVCQHGSQWRTQEVAWVPRRPAGRLVGRRQRGGGIEVVAGFKRASRAAGRLGPPHFRAKQKVALFRGGAGRDVLPDELVAHRDGRRQIGRGRTRVWFDRQEAQPHAGNTEARVLNGRCAQTECA